MKATKSEKKEEAFVTRKKGTSIIGITESARKEGKVSWLMAEGKGGDSDIITKTGGKFT